MSSVEVLQGDCRVVLPTLAAGSVHCVITSPPYWGLRSYDGGEAEIGQEAELGDYIATLVQVFREVRRVLRADGTLWLNMGDCYASIGKGHPSDAGRLQKGTGRTLYNHQRNRSAIAGLKSKDLVGLAWRVAFALQDDGWYLRSDIIWAKPNPMPESVLDRPTRAHEYLFLLSKSERYFYDADAIRELAGPTHSIGRGSAFVTDRVHATHKRKLVPLVGNHGASGHDGNGKRYERVYNNPAGRNKRDVWTVAAAGFPGAHFATFPPRLIEPCILAGTSATGACSSCGAPWRRLTVREFKPQADVSLERGRRGAGDQKALDPSDGRQGYPRGTTTTTTAGWEACCTCPTAAAVPCVVLDPFAGSGTTLRVAVKHRRSAIGIELNAAYCQDLIEQSVSGVQMALGVG